MRTNKIICPYCKNSQRIYFLSYPFINFFNLFSKHERQIPTKIITQANKVVKNFSCKQCLKQLIYFFNIDNKNYFVDGVNLKYVRDSILQQTNGIKSLKNKIFKLENDQMSPESEKLLEFLRIKVIKEEEKLKHLIEENKELTLNL